MAAQNPQENLPLANGENGSHRRDTSGGSGLARGLFKLTFEDVRDIYAQFITTHPHATEEDFMDLFINILRADNDRTFADSPFILPTVIRCLVDHLDFQSLKNLRSTCNTMWGMVDPFFYKKATHKIANSTKFYKFLKEQHRGVNYGLITTKMKRIEFSGEIDLFEVSRIMYRGRDNLEEVSIFTQAAALRGEFQNIAAVLPVMEKLHTLRFELPRRYLLHQLFRSSNPLKIKTIQFNFENAYRTTIQGIFETCPLLECIEMHKNQEKYIDKLAVASIELAPLETITRKGEEIKVYQINRKE